MDFLDPKKKRAHTIQLYIGYALVAIAIGFGATILLYVALGYGVDRRGNVIQNGLVFLDSRPDSAEVNITNQDDTFTDQTLTSRRMVLPADTYTFEYLKEDYRPWERTVDLRGGQIVRLTYPFLFPEDLETEDILEYNHEPDFVSINPSSSRIIFQQPTFNQFEVLNVNNLSDEPEEITFPTALFNTGYEQSLELIEWAENNRHILVSNSYSDQTDYLVLDTSNPQNSININELFALDPEEVKLFDGSSNQLYMLLDNNRLVSADIEDRTVTQLVEDVVAFNSYGRNEIVYIRDNNNDDEVDLRIWDDGDIYTIRSLPIDNNYHLDIDRFNGNWYIAAGHEEGNNVYIYRNPVSVLEREDDENKQISTRTLHIENPQNIAFSDNAQFLVAQSGQNFAVYDAEADNQYRYETEDEFDETDSVTWMDGYRLHGSVDGRVMVFDFDGSNKQMLSSTIADKPIMFDSDYDNLLTLRFNQNQESFILTQTALTVD